MISAPSVTATSCMLMVSMKVSLWSRCWRHWACRRHPGCRNDQLCHCTAYVVIFFHFLSMESWGLWQSDEPMNGEQFSNIQLSLKPLHWSASKDVESNVKKKLSPFLKDPVLRVCLSKETSAGRWGMTFLKARQGLADIYGFFFSSKAQKPILFVMQRQNCDVLIFRRIISKYRGKRKAYLILKASNRRILESIVHSWLNI